MPPSTKSAPYRLLLFIGAFIASVVLLVAYSGAKKTDSGTVGVQPDKTDTAYANSAAQPSLFTVSDEQLSHLQTVGAHRATWSVSVQTTGTVDWDADHTTQAITQVNGPISRILVDLGSQVKAGDPLLYVLSPDVANGIATYRKARNRENLTKRIADRQKGLLDRGAIAVKDYESSESDYNDATTDVQNSLQALKIFGISKQEIDDAEQQGKPITPELAVRAPIAGMIVQKMVSPGQLIQAGTTACFMLSNVSTVWVQGHVFDHDLPSIKVGDEVDETNAALDRTFRGKIAYIGAFLDPATRTTPVRIVTENPQGLLKKDMFLNAAIHTGAQKNILVVPVSALLRDAQNEPIVYVETEHGKFAQRSVSVGTTQGGEVEILSGLQEGDKVVADGSLFLQFANTYQ